jgi:hypothetical protein
MVYDRCNTDTSLTHRHMGHVPSQLGRVETAETINFISNSITVTDRPG